MGNKWLQDRIKALGKTQTGLGELLGLSRASMTKLINGTRLIKAAEVATIARFCEWPENKVLKLIDDQLDIDQNVDLRPQPVEPIRVIGEVKAGDFKEALEYCDDDQFDIYVPVPPKYRGLRRYALKVCGPSMNRIYPDGTFIVVIATIDMEEWAPSNGQRVVVHRTNNAGQLEATVKEIEFDRDGHAWLWPRSDHPEFAQPWRVPEAWDGNGDFEEHANNIRITGLVIGSYRPEL